MLRVDIAHDFKDFHLEARFESGKGVTALFGPSGAGKSTLLKMIAGLIRPKSGTITLDDTPFFENGRAMPASSRRIGLVFQDARLFPHLNVLQNLQYGARFARGPAIVERAEVIKILDLEKLLRRHVTTLSGGEAQRVAIGRALLSAPRMLLLDEPLANLDAPRKTEILPYLDRIKEEAHVPILYVTHSMDEIARLADRIVLLKGGRVLRQGSVFDVLSDPDAIPMIGVREAGAILPARVVKQGAPGELSRLKAGGGTLELPGITHPVGSRLRLRIMAQDVIIARKRPVGLSAMNQLLVRIRHIRQGEGPGAALVLEAGRDTLLARVTSQSVERLDLQPGMRCFAILKSMSVAPGAITLAAAAPQPPSSEPAAELPTPPEPEPPADPAKNLDPNFLAESLKPKS